VEAFGPEIEQALEHPVDFKSALQELLARRGSAVGYEIASEEGPPHERSYVVVAKVDGEDLGRGSGRSKKHAEQEAAREAVDRLEG
jgi:ribonuclease III